MRSSNRVEQGTIVLSLQYYCHPFAQPPHYDRHAAYVRLSRHRESATVFYAAEDFGAQPENETQRQEIQKRMFAALSRARPKELVHDFLDMNPPASGSDRSAPAHAQETSGHPAPPTLPAERTKTDFERWREDVRRAREEANRARHEREQRPERARDNERGEPDYER